jgi:hypothetical protein
MDSSNLVNRDALLILTWVFGWAIIILIFMYLRNKKRQKTLELIHKERLAAMAKGIPMPEWPDYDVNGKGILAEGLRGGRSQNPKAPLGAGAILVMIGAGICLAFYLVGIAGLRPLWPLGLIVVFTGIGLFIHYFLTKGGKA